MIPFIVSFVVWAGLHSVTAAQFFKDGVRRLVGAVRYQQLYRLLYNGLAVLSFGPVIYFYWLLPNTTIWQIDSPWSWLFLGLQLVGALGAAVSIIQTDPLSFIGLRQLVAPTTDAEQSKTAGLGETLYVSGLYRWMRHPLYTFSLLFLWSFPLMGQKLLIFNLLASAYFIIGSLFEERRLTADFGQAYREYQARVPRFLPFRRPTDN